MTTQLDLSRGERLEIDRRRRRLTQREAAEAYGVGPHVYGRWEHDHHRDAPLVKVGDITAAEWCFVKRRRSGLKLRELSALTGLGVKWIHKAERGEARDVEPLVVWWQQNPNPEKT